jgi:uncharacterized protein YukE
MGGHDRNSYDTGASGQAQSNLASVAAQLESLISMRDAQVKAAMANFQADGVSDEYHAKEQQWNRAAAQVRQIIALVKQNLERNDETATTALARARSAVGGIG